MRLVCLGSPWRQIHITFFFRSQTWSAWALSALAFILKQALLQGLWWYQTHFSFFLKKPFCKAFGGTKPILGFLEKALLQGLWWYQTHFSFFGKSPFARPLVMPKQFQQFQSPFARPWIFQCLSFRSSQRGHASSFSYFSLTLASASHLSPPLQSWLLQSNLWVAFQQS